MTYDHASRLKLEDWLLTQAISASDTGDYDEAYRYYSRAFSLTPTSVLLSYNWAITALRRGDRQQLAVCASRLLTIAPEDWRTSIAQAYLTEVNGEAQTGWELCQQTYERVRNTKALKVVEALTPDVLLFAYRNQLKTGLEEIISQVFETGAFPEGVLDALRKIEGRRSRRAFDYSVVVEGDFSEPAFPTSDRYVRSYRVLAEDEEEASQTVIDFESRCGEKGLKVISVEAKGSEDTEVELGVWWRLAARLIA